MKNWNYFDYGKKEPTTGPFDYNKERTGGYPHLTDGVSPFGEDTYLQYSNKDGVEAKTPNSFNYNKKAEISGKKIRSITIKANTAQNKIDAFIDDMSTFALEIFEKLESVEDQIEQNKLMLSSYVGYSCFEPGASDEQISNVVFNILQSYISEEDCKVGFIGSDIEAVLESQTIANALISGETNYGAPFNGVKSLVFAKENADGLTSESGISVRTTSGYVKITENLRIDFNETFEVKDMVIIDKGIREEIEPKNPVLDLLIKHGIAEVEYF